MMSYIVPGGHGDPRLGLKYIYILIWKGLPLWLRWKRICLRCLIPGLGRCPGEGNGKPLQYSCLENSMDRGAWWATVNGIAKSRT